MERQTYSSRPPAAYRLAEPGDSLDKAALYAACAGFFLAVAGWWTTSYHGRTSGLWPAALGLTVIGIWETACPWPTIGGWHGLNWRAAFDPTTPPTVRAILGIGAVILLAWQIGWATRRFPERDRLFASAHAHRASGLLLIVAVGIAWRILGLPDGEPRGYASRWGFVLAMLALVFAMLRLMPAWGLPIRQKIMISGMMGVACLGLIGGGRWMIWYHRPLDRLREVAPGKIYISAMPSPGGLPIAQERYGFRTIINVFNEELPGLRSPLLPAERTFADAQGIRYLGAPDDVRQSDAFLDETLRLAQDPDAWPILVHCHGCMDRSPAWMGIYRFLIQQRPLKEVLAEIEGHRGSRPKASVTLLYNRVLSTRAPERYASDPTARQLLLDARGTPDPFKREYQAAARAIGEPNPTRLGRVERRGRGRPDGRRRP